MAQDKTAAGADHRQRRASAAHGNLLRHRNGFYLRVALLLCGLAIAAYLFSSPEPRHSGGSWLGYLLGVVSAALIVWLTMLGLRKRAITPGKWSLKGWTSAHVYLGLSLIVLATLHTGFQFGWNIHTLAYVLMMVVIASGLFGIVMYSVIPRQMSDNRAQIGVKQMLDETAAIDVDLRAAAQPLAEAPALLVQDAIERTVLGGTLLQRLATRHPKCPTLLAAHELREMANKLGSSAGDLGGVVSLLERKQAMLARARRHIRFRALLEVWLYLHVPFTFGLLIALTAHIVSVFYFW
jgi:hypothetical protein